MWNLKLIFVAIGMVFIMAIPAVLIVTWFKFMFFTKPSNKNAVSLDKDKDRSFLFDFDDDIRRRDEQSSSTISFDDAFTDPMYASFVSCNLWHDSWHDS